MTANIPVCPKLHSSHKTGVQVSDLRASTHLSKNSERCCLRDRGEHHKFDRRLSKREFFRSICFKNSYRFLMQRRYASSSPRTTPRTTPEAQLAPTTGVLAPPPGGNRTACQPAGSFWFCLSSNPEELKVQDTASGNIVHTVPEV